MVLIAIPLGLALVMLAFWLMTAKQDWFAKLNAVTHTSANRERYPIGYAGAKVGIPLVLLLSGALMTLYGLIGAIELFR